MEYTMEWVRKHRQPILVHAKVPLLGHHTSGVRKEWYRTPQDLAKHANDDPGPKLRKLLLQIEGISAEYLDLIEAEEAAYIQNEFELAVAAPEPDPAGVADHVFVPTPITEETGDRCPEGREKVVMVDAALHAVEEILQDHPEALFYGRRKTPGWSFS
jgi:2-oxoisovalerate dehydrogenase E1 component